MNLQDLFTNLSYGELSNLALSGDGSGAIPAEHQPKILGYANQALKELFSRFFLREKEAVISPFDHITMYYLRPEYAVSNKAVPGTKYIQDVPSDPFVADVVRILAVRDELGDRLHLNVHEEKYSLFTPQFDCLQHPFPSPDQTLFVAYQAHHPVLVPDDLTQEIFLPVPLEAALQARIAAKVYAPMNGPEHRAKAQECLLRYEALCAEVEQQGLVNQTPALENNKFTMRGWV